ncbi:hypothetical protein LFL96_06410 [Paraburkholderia sp. D15]|uniref:CC0125/CC1285 family lipoprotein n=1 Tax=Paraburkholderia sp. D15 TaxID=2880218 RepID=UPI0024796435|nr:hypothetical protein [Paraburkholderia sp. D15]WGS51131.1 hypothetical protein LFL96_06410 [Paraburkholderia sp. D15]
MLRRHKKIVLQQTGQTGIGEMKFNVKGTLFALATVAWVSTLAGCTTAYQASGATGGYKDRQIDDQTLHVEFRGNGYTTRDTVHKYFMYRCAELTQQHGFKYFMIIPTALTGALAPTDNLVGSRGFDRSMMRKVHSAAPIVIYSGGVGSVSYPSDAGDIRMFNDDAVMPAKITGWDAAEIVDQLGTFVHSNGKTPAALPMGWVFEPGHPKVRAQDLLPSAPKSSVVSGA